MLVYPRPNCKMVDSLATPHQVQQASRDVYEPYALMLNTSSKSLNPDTVSFIVPRALRVSRS